MQCGMVASIPRKRVTAMSGAAPIRVLGIGLDGDAHPRFAKLGRHFRGKTLLDQIYIRHCIRRRGLRDTDRLEKSVSFCKHRKLASRTQVTQATYSLFVSLPASSETCLSSMSCKDAIGSRRKEKYEPAAGKDMRCVERQSEEGERKPGS